MPFYEYQCKACQHLFEAMQKISDPALTTCPECNQDKLTKLVSSPAFQLKGTGWYVTDFKNKEAKPPAPQSTSSEGGGTTTSTTSSTGEKK